MGDPNTKVSLPSGVIVGKEKPGAVEREVPEGEPPAWPANSELSVVGKPTRRLDGALKVTGGARYTADIRLPGMLYARVVRSPHPHARIQSIDTNKAARHPGVRAVHVLEHLLGVAKSAADAGKSFPTVRYAGQPIAAVAADTPAAADEAARLVKVAYETLPFVVDLDAARKAGAPLVFAGSTEQSATAGGGGAQQAIAQKGNVRGPARSGPAGPPQGDVKKGLAEADVVVDATYRTQVQTHSALETHGVVAHYEPDQLTIYASTQGTKTVRDELAEIFSLPKSKIRVITEFMGAGFGAKFGAGNYGVLATHLSKKAGAPVRLMLDRKEEHLSVGNRPSSHQRLRIGAKKDGALTAIHLVSHGTAGAAAGAGSGGPAKNMYPCPNILIEEHDVFTHAGPGAAFRAPGHPQGCFALEQSVDELAEKLRVDPLQLRDRIDNDDTGLVDSASRRRERSIGAKRVGWGKRHAPGADAGPVKRGVGVAQSVWYRIIDLDSSCEVRIMRDGSVMLSSAVQDIGTGIRTALAQVVAEELGLRATNITIRIGDTNFPNGPASGGSKTTDSITPAARRAAYEVKQTFIEQVAKAHGVDAQKVVLEGGKVRVADKVLTFRAAAAKLRTEQISATAGRPDDYGGYARGSGTRRIGVGGMGGVQFAEVSVDTETGIIQVDRIVAVHDCGRPINPLAIESQINGGVIQGISYALYENRLLDPREGVMLNANFDSYKIAGAREVPKIEAVLVEEYRGRSNTDASGIGEPATVPTAAAIANAVYNAIGVRIRELPMTPARVLAALAKKEGR